MRHSPCATPTRDLDTIADNVARVHSHQLLGRPVVLDSATAT
jgi:hypothetical protein